MRYVFKAMPVALLVALTSCSAFDSTPAAPPDSKRHDAAIDVLVMASLERGTWLTIPATNVTIKISKPQSQWTVYPIWGTARYEAPGGDQKTSSFSFETIPENPGYVLHSFRELVSASNAVGSTVISVTIRDGDGDCALYSAVVNWPDGNPIANIMLTKYH